ncbi:MAG: outer membrane protein assembly factor BamD [Myxococcota bacterium]
MRTVEPHRIVRFIMRSRSNAGSLFLLLVASCGGASARGEDGVEKLADDATAQQSYEDALADFRDDRCIDAEPSFRQVRREFPYSRFAALAELRIADCLLMQDSHAEAIQAYRQFVRFRPSHPEVPYARFKVAQAYYDQIPTSWFLVPPSYERDQEPTRQALSKLRRFVVDFPEDPRIQEAKEMSERCLRLLAQHEFAIAKFYRRQEADRAVIIRLRTLLRTYEGSGLEPEALWMLGQAHVRMDQVDLAREAFRELISRFPQSEPAQKAREAVRRL